jgi:hypothetical protein
MNQARRDATATLLNNGKVLIAGGLVQPPPPPLFARLSVADQLRGVIQQRLFTAAQHRLLNRGRSSLRQSRSAALEPWQQEIRDYVGTARKPTLFAQNNLVKWGKRRGLVQ